jgi:CheY-like chemotaxis protein
VRLLHHHPGHDPFAGAPGVAPASGRMNLLLTDSTAQTGTEPDTWVRRLPQLLEPLGIQAHHAASGTEASALLGTMTIHIAVVDLGLPLEHVPAPAHAPEAGWRLLEILSRLGHRPPTVAIKSARTRRDEARELNAALRLGAFAVVDRPRSTRELEILLEVLRRCLLRHYRGRWPAQNGT